MGISIEGQSVATGPVDRTLHVKENAISIFVGLVYGFIAYCIGKGLHSHTKLYRSQVQDVGLFINLV